ncbi:unannotated protein [freshwater metagenome]|uniref:Unannotated protein n=1 Tax=freshwater metagenome TaxID=449393 RepID=A0A6J7QVZ0_9ZZZZ
MDSLSVPANSKKVGNISSITGAVASIRSVIPVICVMYSGIGVKGFTNDSKWPRYSPDLTFTAPISVIAAPFFGEAPVVSRSTITNVTC